MHQQPILNWKDYWNQFDSLVQTIRERGHTGLADDLKFAQEYVNGLTDGWFEFVSRFQQAMDLHSVSLKDEELMKAKELLQYVKTILKR